MVASSGKPAKMGNIENSSSFFNKNKILSVLSKNLWPFQDGLDFWLENPDLATFTGESTQ